MQDPTSLEQLPIETLIKRWPQTMLILQAFRTACLGCPVAPFCTLIEVARDYQLPLNVLLQEITALIPAEDRASVMGSNQKVGAGSPFFQEET